VIDSVAAEARIRGLVRETPLRRSAALSEATGADVWLKLENRQETGAFKLRGAANKLLSLPREAAARGVVTASTGNHALAVATVAGRLGIAVEIFVSEHLHPAKRSRIEALGARLNAVPGDPLLAEVTARRESERSGRPYVSPYNDADVIAGQGTIAVEILRQLEGRSPDAVYVAVGGGGLIAGIGLHLKQASPATAVVGCWPRNSPALYECLRAGRIVDVPESPTMSTSTAGGVEPGAITLALCARAVDRRILVTEDEILDAARRVLRTEDELIEGAAGVAVAAFLKEAGQLAGRTVVLVICGGNLDPPLEARVRGNLGADGLS
jgi:threonine dehydratase